MHQFIVTAFAIVVIAVGIWYTRRQPRTNVRRPVHVPSPISSEDLRDGIERPYQRPDRFR